MQYRQLGNTSLRVSVLGFGCGAVGGLMVRGEHADMVRAAELALEAGINYFDSARGYGNGLSEIHTGAVLRELGATDALVATKVHLAPGTFTDIEGAIEEQIDNSLKRLGRDHVDIVYTHNRIGQERDPDGRAVSLDDLERITGVFRRAEEAGTLRVWGFTGLGETEAVHAAVQRFRPGAVQTCYNLLNPSSGYPMRDGFPFQDYRQLMPKAAALGTGTVAIRVLAAGALSGSVQRHPVAAQSVAPIASGRTLEDDAERAGALGFLIDEGVADSLVEAAIRFAIGTEHLSTALVGLASVEQLEHALASADKGPLSGEAVARLRTAWDS